LKEKKMKFQTQHKNFIVIKDGIKKESYRAHREGNSVWVTGGEKNTIVANHEYHFVSQAKKWMDMPSLKF